MGTAWRGGVKRGAQKTHKMLTLFNKRPRGFEERKALIV